ncbi:MAG: caspase family protein [Leptolyngbya sp. Prado105]|jgi:hypothetical protein|nr:caspase family protein [Leptolyngbya sp. Prado105]
MTQAPNPIQKRWAFLVGIDRFDDPQVNRLNFCVNDVLALKEILEKLDYIVVTLHDQQEAHRQPTRDNVEAELQQLCEMVEKDDLLFVHFACHGKLIKGQPVLVLKDSRVQLLSRAEKRLSVEQVKQMMRDSGASRLFLSLDACHTGIDMGRGEDDLEFIRNVYELAEGFVVIAGSTAQQKAFELKSVEHGVYSYYLLKALAGEADRTGKTFVSVDDVEKYLTDQFKRWGASTGLQQEPTIEKAGMGDMILADWRDRTPPSLATPFPDLRATSTNTRDSSQQLTPFERQRRERDRNSLQSEWKLRSEKLERLRQAFAIEVDTARTFQLEKQIQAEEEEIKRLENRLSAIDVPSESNSEVSPKALSPDQLEKRELEKLYAKLSKKYEAISEQIEGELNVDNQETLRARKETIQREMGEVWNRLQDL